MRKLVVLVLVVSLLFSLTACSSQQPAKEAQKEEAAPQKEEKKWPIDGKEIRIIVVYKEGGASHRSAMLLKKFIDKKKLLSEPVVVVAMPGANTVLGQEEVLKAKPDGHTILLHHNAMVNAAALGKYDFNYDDFKQVAQVWKSPIILAAKKDAPYDNFAELLAYIKEHPGEVKWAWSHLGGNTHFNSYLIFDKAGIDPDKDIQPIVTSGGAQSAQYLAGGMCDVALELPSSFAEYVKAGEFKVLGQSGATEQPMFGKTILPFKEQGADYAYELRMLLHAPKDTPDWIIDEWNKVLKEVVNDPEYIEVNEKEMNTVEFLAGEEATKAFAQEAINAEYIAEKIKKAMAEAAAK
jgi:tripartite-type tricarboxylate transporter receptor subunit TctC